MSAANYALFTIPAYLVIAMFPHAYSVWLITTNNNNKWDLQSPRSTNNRSKTEASVPKHIYRRFERCRSAHENMLENMAFVVGGILSGVVTRLDAEWMNLMCGLYLVSRILYTISYVSIASAKWAPMRTAWYL
ncbi:uncharacterized protein HMPREF1541_03609 [Cyphellophora europaea CBS 101466]|uniref:MAPEG family protein n=1 Tax=Cyphellophora europaea (strain CBS 101466) TaxID=1220924 RepID=W2S0V0_CYPE1|nr:uncharacterized protein HMPREF1541_03609 [Cyphellophora europaea CBS 101466]ETN41673.1 hypothetical protein HMPREF1541_03609 [Cyphellophora europaea CBS 101466]